MSERKSIALSEPELATLLEEIAAMIQSNRPLVPELLAIETGQLGRLRRAAQSLRRDLEAGRSLGEGFERLSPKLSGQGKTAIQLASETGNVEGLRQLAILLRQRRSLRTTAFVAYIYPAFTLVLGCVVLWFTVAHFQNLLQATEHFAGPVKVMTILSGYWWVLPLVALGLMVILLRLARLPGRFGRLALFCDTLAWELDSDLPLNKALPYAAQLAGDRQLAGEMPQWVEAHNAGASGPAQSGLPPMLKYLLGHLRSDTTVAASSVGIGTDAAIPQLKNLAVWYRQLQVDRFRWLVHWIPTAIVLVIGGCCVTSYLLAVLFPIYRELGEVL